MGTLAVAASGFMWAKRTWIGNTLAGVVVAFVGGWFIYESFIEKGLGQGELRMYLIIVLSLVEALVLYVPTKTIPSTGNEKTASRETAAKG